MVDITPHILISLVALGMGLAFVSADRESGASRAFAAALGFLGIAMYLNVSLVKDLHNAPAWSGWLAVPEALATIALLEWLIRVRRMVPAARGMNVVTGDRVLRSGQVAGVVYAVLAICWPQIRAQDFLRAGLTEITLAKWGFWMFAAPVLYSTFAGLVGVLFLLNRRPDRAEKTRLLALMLCIPFLLAGFVLSLNAAAISVVIGEIILLIGAVHYHVLQGQRGQFMSRFLSPQVAKMVSDRGLSGAMQQKQLEITVVSCDLRGFTAYAQAHSSTQVLQVLREYYDAVGIIVADFGATIKDFAGDGILILVGAPLPADDHAKIGLEMARRIRIVTTEMTRRWSTPTHSLGIGLGVATGVVTVGVIGSASRLEYTAVGSAVNLSSRLCEQAHHGDILVDTRTVALAGDGDLEQRAPLSVKGFGDAVSNFALN
ncbi:adenylate/guanylate cyclase domain-containing protein [Stenotrophobium rhamnosiphilum]|uniref:Adenylate/guanylate cyclase domain-containing protein n=1 Tax=Stenotrophobium rhamnosiphilum TaxID=2029166 RepID=A0A2T5MDW3_9GAMM|nr:adenylate/guanylate cyclase domain-containing protein [Stenotrophobium rhamnosiphilum]PTU30752.1 adenylate/guanylate cyclase domain-containing protein [Stenotrophobium rhamnosiphilum]